MSRMDIRKVVALGSVAFVCIAVGIAGVASWSRRGVERDLQDAISRAEELRAQLAARAESVERDTDEGAPPAPAWQLLRGPEVVETLQALQEIGDRTGVMLDEQKALPAGDAGKQAFSVTGHGVPTAVCTFLAEVERAGRLMVVESGRVVASGGDQLTFQIGVGTYHARRAR